MDTFKNFAKATVSTGYDAAATSVILTTGHGAKLPTPPFNATWWNVTDYPDPSDDPNVEIVRVTALATDTLTIARAQESTSASTKNTAGKTYKLVPAITAKTLADLGIWQAAATLAITSATTLDVNAAGKVCLCNGTSANYTITLPTASSMSGKVIHFAMSTGLTKLVTVAANGGELIDGSNTRIMWARESATLFSDGAAWYKVGGRSIPFYCLISLLESGVIYQAQSIADQTMTKIVHNQKDDPSGLMGDISNSIITICRSGQYNLKAAVGYSAYSSSWTASRVLARVFKNTSTELLGSEVNNASGGWPTFTLPAVRTFAAGDVLHQSTYQNSGGPQYLYGANFNALSVEEIVTW